MNSTGTQTGSWCCVRSSHKMGSKKDKMTAEKKRGGCDFTRWPKKGYATQCESVVVEAAQLEGRRSVAGCAIKITMRREFFLNAARNASGTGSWIGLLGPAWPCPACLPAPASPCKPTSPPTHQGPGGVFVCSCSRAAARQIKMGASGYSFCRASEMALDLLNISPKHNVQVSTYPGHPFPL